MSLVDQSTGLITGLLRNQGEKYKLLFHKGSSKKKSIKVWYSKAQISSRSKVERFRCKLA